MDVDEALTSLGRWGKWQILFYVLLSIANTFPASWHMLAIVFIGKCSFNLDQVNPSIFLNYFLFRRLEEGS